MRTVLGMGGLEFGLPGRWGSGREGAPEAAEWALCFLSRRLWTDLQRFCCSQGKCNFHKNPDVNCTAAVSGENCA